MTNLKTEHHKQDVKLQYHSFHLVCYNWDLFPVEQLRYLERYRHYLS